MCSDLAIRQAEDPRVMRKPWGGSRGRLFSPDAFMMGCAGHDRGLKTGKQWLYVKIAGSREHMGGNRVRLGSV